MTVQRNYCQVLIYIFFFYLFAEGIWRWNWPFSLLELVFFSFRWWISKDGRLGARWRCLPRSVQGKVSIFTNIKVFDVFSQWLRNNCFARLSSISCTFTESFVFYVSSQWMRSNCFGRLSLIWSSLTESFRVIPSRN